MHRLHHEYYISHISFASLYMSLVRTGAPPHRSKHSFSDAMWCLGYLDLTHGIIYLFIYLSLLISCRWKTSLPRSTRLCWHSSNRAPSASVCSSGLLVLDLGCRDSAPKIALHKMCCISGLPHGRCVVLLACPWLQLCKVTSAPGSQSSTFARYHLHLADVPLQKKAFIHAAQLKNHSPHPI